MRIEYPSGKVVTLPTSFNTYYIALHTAILDYYTRLTRSLLLLILV